MPTPSQLNGSLNPGTPLIDLYKLDATAIAAVGIVLYFTNHISASGAFVKFRGTSYIAIPCMGDGFEEASGGVLPRPTFTASDLNYAISSQLDGKGIEGSILYRQRVYAVNLDDGTDPRNAVVSTHKYMVESMLEGRWGESIKWQLAAPHDLPNLTLPRRAYLRNKGFPGVGRRFK